MCGTLATGGNTIVANGTVIHEVGVINTGGHPNTGGMAVITLLGRYNVRRWLTASSHIVVTTGTCANDLRVIYGTGCDGRPGCQTGIMTGIALVCRINMRSGLTGCGHAIVTTDAGTNQLGMIYCRRLHRVPGSRSGRMAGITLIGTLNMIGPFTGCHNTIMTTDACTNDLGMIYTSDRDGYPWCRSGLMARIAGICRVDVGWTFA